MRLRWQAGSDEELTRILFTLVGLVSGLLVYALSVFEVTRFDPWIISATFFLSAFANFFYLSFDRERPAAALGISAGMAALLALFLWLRIRDGDMSDDGTIMPFFILYWIIPQVALPLYISGATQGWKHPDYEILHRKAWNLPLIWAGAMLLILLVALVLGLWAFLFTIIGIDVFSDMFVERWFYLPVLGAVSGLGVAITREREKTIAALRDLCQNLYRVVLPLLAVLYVIFAPLFLLLNLGLLNVDGPERGATTFAYIMMIFLLVGVFALNTAIGYDKDSAVQSRIQRIAARVTVWMLPLLCVFPAFYLGQLVSQYGLTPTRLLGLIVLYLLAGYAVSYLLAARLWRKDSGDWMAHIRRANIPMAYLVLVIAIWLASPFGNVQHIAAFNQVDRLLSGKVTAGKFDFTALKFEFGKPGQAALAYIGTHIADHPERDAINEKLEKLAFQRSRYDARTDIDEKPAYVFHPADAEFPRGFSEEKELRYQCAKRESNTCHILALSSDRFALVVERPNHNVRFTIFTRRDNGDWSGRYISPELTDTEKKSVLENLGAARLIDRSHKALKIGDVIVDPYIND